MGEPDRDLRPRAYLSAGILPRLSAGLPVRAVGGRDTRACDRRDRRFLPRHNPKSGDRRGPRALDPDVRVHAARQPARDGVHRDADGRAEPSAAVRYRRLGPERFGDDLRYPAQHRGDSRRAVRNRMGTRRDRSAGQAAGTHDAPGARLLDDARDRLRDLAQIGIRTDSGRDHRHRAVSNWPRVELDPQALQFDRGVLPRDFGQRVQPDGAARRTPPGRLKYLGGDIVLRARDEPVGAALRIRRVDIMARPHADAPAVRVVYRGFWILHGRAPDA